MFFMLIAAQVRHVGRWQPCRPTSVEAMGLKFYPDCILHKEEKLFFRSFMFGKYCH